MALGSAYGGGGPAVATGAGVPRLARKADGNYAVFADLAALRTHYQNISKPKAGYAPVVGTVSAVTGEVTGITAAYEWNTSTASWDAVVNALKGADGKDGKNAVSAQIQGAWVSGTKYTLGQMVRYTDQNNRKGLYQVRVDSTTDEPNNAGSWDLVFEETYIGPRRRRFDFELLSATIPRGVQELGTSYTRVIISWNITSLSSDSEKITKGTLTEPGGGTRNLSTRTIETGQMTLKTARSRPSNSCFLHYTLTLETDKGKTVDKSFSLRWDSPMYYGFKAEATLTEAQIKNDLTKTLVNCFPRVQNITRTTTAQEYVYLILPHAEGLPTSYVIGYAPFLIRTAEITMDGYLYIVYRSAAKTIQRSFSVAANG